MLDSSRWLLVISREPSHIVSIPSPFSQDLKSAQFSAYACAGRAIMLENILLGILLVIGCGAVILAPWVVLGEIIYENYKGKVCASDGAWLAVPICGVLCILEVCMF